MGEVGPCAQNGVWRVVQRSAHGAMCPINSTVPMPHASVSDAGAGSGQSSRAIPTTVPIRRRPNGAGANAILSTGVDIVRTILNTPERIANNSARGTSTGAWLSHRQRRRRLQRWTRTRRKLLFAQALTD